MSNAHIRKMFPGAVTAQGFFSYYNYIIESDAEHIFVIKGGPGVGKSTFMKKIGESMLQLGYDMELHCCSSDNNSIDGLVIPQLNIALLDGTAPHVVDPKNPGAVDEIINLGDYWDKQAMRSAKEEIMANNYQVGRYFQRAYLALSEAKLALNEWKFYVSEYQDWGEINRIYLEVEQALSFQSSGGSGKARHLFAWAHTPEGKVQYIDTLLKGCHTFYALQGQPGAGKSTFLVRVAERALTHGYYVEYYHNTLDPSQIDLIIIPSLETALGTISEPYAYTPNVDGTINHLNFDHYISQSMMTRHEGDMQDCRTRFNHNLERALKNSSEAKKTHDLMETYYVAAMDFPSIEKKRFAVMQRILAMAERNSVAVQSSGLPIET